MNREQARAEALKVWDELVKENEFGLIIGNGYSYLVYSDYADVGCEKRCERFPFDPPIEAPPKNTIVEVWNDDPGQAMIGFSSGILRDGKLVISWRREPLYDGCFRNWKVIEMAK